MSIFSAPAYPHLQGVKSCFLAEAAGFDAVGINTRRAVQDGTHDRAGDRAGYGLNPPDTSPAARIARIVALIRKGEPDRALSRAARLLNDGTALSPDLDHHLRLTIEAGLHALAVAGQTHEAHIWRRRLLPSFEPSPAPALHRRPQAPGFALTA